MTLAATQDAFLAQLADDAAPLPAGWDGRAAAGMAIYRNAYRARLIDALAETFPVTQEWVGEGPFSQAAAHHVIVDPPSSWSLDHAGLGFAKTLADLFAIDPEVAELARLEWAMHALFVAVDAEPLDEAGFAAAVASFGEDDWSQMRLSLMPGLAVIPVSTCCAAIWRALTERHEPPHKVMLPEAGALVVWRDNIRPVFRTATRVEADALEMMGQGRSFGEVCASIAAVIGDSNAARQAGAMLGKWIGEGLVVGLDLAIRQTV